MKLKFPHYLLIFYIIYSIILAINPFDRFTWFGENLLVWILVLALVLTYKKFKFSNTSYLMMSVLVFMHTLGGHYTFELVPFDFITNLFGWTRNHFDRFAHFSVGFFAYPIAEILMKTKKVKLKSIIIMFGVFAIIAFAGIYEVIEWFYAAASNSELGAAFLGSQGDIWDAQKDILMDTMGAVLAGIIFFFKNKKELKKISK